MEFRDLTLANLDEVISLEVAPEQKELVADNLYSIAQAGLDPSGSCRAVYVEDKPAGFFFIKEQANGSRIYLCRFMIDRRYQGCGLGLRTMRQLLDNIFSAPAVELVDLAVSHAKGGAETFYEKCGFVPTGEPYKGGWRMVLLRDRYLETRIPCE